MQMASQLPSLRKWINGLNNSEEFLELEPLTAINMVVYAKNKELPNFQLSKFYLLSQYLLSLLRYKYLYLGLIDNLKYSESCCKIFAF
jgi:hypothetical protein